MIEEGDKIQLIDGSAAVVLGVHNHDGAPFYLVKNFNLKSQQWVINRYIKGEECLTQKKKSSG